MAVSVPHPQWYVARVCHANVPRDSLWDEAIQNLLNLNMGVEFQVYSHVIPARFESTCLKSAKNAPKNAPKTRQKRVKKRATGDYDLHKTRIKKNA